jgi:nicotinamidase-related amidase
MNKVLIIVDMQNIFLKNMSSKNKNTLIQNQLSIIKSCINKKIPVIELEYNARAMPKGKTISDLHKKYTPYCTIVKTNNGGFTKTILDNVLKELKVKEIILIGINANGCVHDTAMGAINRGYKVTTALEAIASVWRNDLKLSKGNLAWYKKNTKLLASSAELTDYL